MAETPELVEIDAILDVLDDEVSAASPSAELRRGTTGRRPTNLRPIEPAASVGLPTPPPVPATARTQFPDLFAAPPPRPPTRPVSPEEKLDDLRRQLKHAETQAVKFREAWA